MASQKAKGPTHRGGGGGAQKSDRLCKTTERKSNPSIPFLQATRIANQFGLTFHVAEAVAALAFPAVPR